MTDNKVIMKDWLPPSCRNQKLCSLQILRILPVTTDITKLVLSIFYSHSLRLIFIFTLIVLVICFILYSSPVLFQKGFDSESLGLLFFRILDLHNKSELGKKVR